MKRKNKKRKPKMLTKRRKRKRKPENHRMIQTIKMLKQTKTTKRMEILKVGMLIEEMMEKRQMKILLMMRMTKLR